MLSKVTLKGTDLQVSQICYGTNMFGTAIDQGKADAILDRFGGHGGNFLDTARCYGDWVPEAPAGASERAIGSWLKRQKRSDIVLATKGGYIDVRSGDMSIRMTPEAVERDLGESLDHLGTDYVDFYWLHADDPSKPVEPIMDALVTHQKAGRIRHFGASNWSSDRVREANAYAKSIGHAGFVALQPFWGLAVPNREKAMKMGYGYYYEDGFAELHADGLVMIPYASQSGGYFTKLDKGDAAEGLRERYDDPANPKRLAAVQKIAKDRGVSINEVVLAYLICQPNQTIPIFGASSPEQVDETVKAVDLKLTPEELAALGTH